MKDDKLEVMKYQWDKDLQKIREETPPPHLVS